MRSREVNGVERRRVSALIWRPYAGLPEASLFYHKLNITIADSCKEAQHARTPCKGVLYRRTIPEISSRLQSIHSIHVGVIKPLEEPRGATTNDRYARNLVSSVRNVC